MDIAEIILRNVECGPYSWIHPSLVEGFDHAALESRNKLTLGRNVANDEADSSDEDVVITEYLKSCICEMRELEKSGQKTPDYLKIQAKDFFDAAVYMMIKWRSSYAATMLGVEHGFISSESCEDVLSTLRILYLQYSGDDQISDILRDFILDQYRYGSLWKQGSGFLNYLSESGVKFLEEIYSRGPWRPEIGISLKNSS